MKEIKTLLTSVVIFNYYSIMFDFDKCPNKQVCLSLDIRCI